MAIAIIDYGMGNLRSVQKALERLGFDAVVTRDPGAIEGAAGVILPGVGAFGACMQNLATYGLVETAQRVVRGGKPFLGICLGMQLLFEESEEFGPVRGLGLLPGRVVRFADQAELKVPHMGWNAIEKRQRPPHLEGIPDGAEVYFVHSYYVVPGDPALTATVTRHGIEFTSSIHQGNVFASQFHPEKSQAVGLRLLENFGKLVTGRVAAPAREAASC